MSKTNFQVLVSYIFIYVEDVPRESSHFSYVGGPEVSAK